MEAEPIAAVGALTDPTRRRAYEAVAHAAEPVGRDDVAATLGIGRTLAAFHLDKLAEAGLIEVVYARRSGRAPGPGAGRPAKLYRRTGAEVTVTLPPRSYVDAGVLLAEAVERAGADHALHQVAEQAGRAAADDAADMLDVLRRRGYEPVAGPSGVQMRNCPFHTLAEQFPPLICGMNLALLTGLADAAGWPVRARMHPQPGHCCVELEST